MLGMVAIENCKQVEDQCYEYRRVYDFMKYAHLSLVGHQPFGNSVDGMEDEQFGDTCLPQCS